LIGVRTQAVFREPRAGDVRDSQADITRAKVLTGYVPTVDLREGLQRTLESFRA
jgi:UDP-N-acetylglucosamine 4-epimerase